MLKQVRQSAFGMGVEDPAPARGFPEGNAATGKSRQAAAMPKLLQFLAIAALLLVVAAEHWYWHESANMVAAKTTQLEAAHEGQHDFDFYVGKWRQHNRRLVDPLTGSKKWVEFDGTAVARTMWDGRANVDEFEAETPTGHIEGMTVRLYNVNTGEWSIYSSSDNAGAFSAPAEVGRFVNGLGEFYENEEIDGRQVCVRLLWQVRSPKQYHWEQAYSTDEGKTWQTNWIIDSNRMEGLTL